jgi:hypothetical protein
MVMPGRKPPNRERKPVDRERTSIEEKFPILYGYRKVFAYVFSHLVLILLIYTGYLDIRTESIALGLLDCLKYMFMALAAGSGLEHMGRGLRSLVNRDRNS